MEFIGVEIVLMLQQQLNILDIYNYAKKIKTCYDYSKLLIIKRYKHETQYNHK